MPLATKRVQYDDPRDAADLVRLLSEYARHEGHSTARLDERPRQLAEFPTAFSVLAYSDAEHRVAIGLVNCFFGFSTFTGRRLVNVHDVIVTESHRGRGVSGVMLEAVERIAMDHDCCRLTLEVYADNEPALRAYLKHGFTRDPARPAVDVYFLRKTLPASGA
jgi:GNAT superfamily N-acetyltransferase